MLSKVMIKKVHNYINPFQYQIKINRDLYTEKNKK